MKIKTILTTVLLALLVSAFVAWLWQNAQPRNAPDLIFKTIANRDIALKDLRGKPVIVTFWATDCPACIKEIPHLIELYQRYHSRGLEIIAVAMYYDPPSHVVEMSRLKQLPYPVALDLRAEHSKAFGTILGTPTTFLISPQGMIVDRKTGLFDLRVMEEKIEELFANENHGNL